MARSPGRATSTTAPLLSPSAPRRRRPSCSTGRRHTGDRQPAQHDALGPGQRLHRSDAALDVANGLTNDGTILLESQNSNYSDTLTTGSGTFTNAADGTIQVAPGLRRLADHHRHAGQPGADQRRHQLVPGHHRYLRRRWRLDHRAGLPLQLRPLRHRQPGVSRRPSSSRDGDTLETNNLPNTTLWVQGNGYIEPDADPDSRRRPDQRRHDPPGVADPNYSDTLATGSGTFTNAADGPSRSRPAPAGRRDDHRHAGQPGPDRRRRHDYDLRTLENQAGTYYAAGGSITGPGYLFNCALYVTVSPASPTTILLGRHRRHAGDQQPAQHDALGAGQRLPRTRRHPDGGQRPDQRRHNPPGVADLQLLRHADHGQRHIHQRRRRHDPGHPAPAALATSAARSSTPAPSISTRTRPSGARGPTRQHRPHQHRRRDRDRGRQARSPTTSADWSAAMERSVRRASASRTTASSTCRRRASSASLSQTVRRRDHLLRRQWNERDRRSRTRPTTRSWAAAATASSATATTSMSPA